MSNQPAKTSRTCAHFNADGTPCTNTTNRADGWCGDCNGFTTPATVHPETGHRETSLEDWTSHPFPLDTDEAYEIAVSSSARTAFSRRHNCTEQQAEPQIRSLLEDLIHDGEIQRNKKGRWRLRFKKEGYGLYLSSDAACVVHYDTHHVERTWAQFKAGVPSRTSAKKHHQRAWVSRLTEQANLSVDFNERFLGAFARSQMGVSFTQATGPAVMQEIDKRLDAVLAHWDGSEGKHELTDPATGAVWLLLGRTAGESAYLFAMLPPSTDRTTER